MNKKDKKFKFINNFPIITIIVVAIIILILLMMYLAIKPYKTINKDGYMILSDNITYNLLNNIITENEDLSIGVAPVFVGDYVYKRLNNYYVGIEKKTQIEYDYPIYSSDGLTIYNVNENIILINSDYEKLKGYDGLTLSHGILYNDGDDEPADNIDYLFLSLDNSIYINTQTMTIKTVNKEYLIPINSPIYFDSKYINYYTFDGNSFNYNRISDIYYDSLIEIGNKVITYDEFLIQMGLYDVGVLEIDKETSEEEMENGMDQDNEIDNGDSSNSKYIKPQVKFSNIDSNVYSITGVLTVNDPSGVITSNPVFEIYTTDDELYLRKRFSSFGLVKITGLSSSTEYKIVGTYKYKTENGIDVVSKFFEETINTKDNSLLEAIEFDSELGDIYPNKIEIKNLKIIDSSLEAVQGINRIVLSIESEENNFKKEFKLSYSQIRNLINGEKINVSSNDNLTSDTVYKYKIKIYDKKENEIKVSGDTSGIIKTSKSIPEIDIKSNINSVNNEINIEIKTKNIDNTNIKDYKYQLYSYSGYLIDEGFLDYENKSIKKLYYDNLDYNMNYILKITGIYDLEDGKGEKKLDLVKDFTTYDLNSNLISWYDQKSLIVSHNSLSTDIHISSETKVLEKDSTEVLVYLVDENGNDILDENGNLKYLKKFKKEEYSSLECNNDYCIKQVNFENLKSNTNYYIKIKIVIKQLEETKYLEKILSPSIKTLEEDAYVEVLTKKLISDELDVKLKIYDPDKLIGSDQVIIEIYKTELSNGKYINSIEDINNINRLEDRFVYREKHNISDTISLNFRGYNEYSYTIVVSSELYKNSEIKYYLNIKSKDKETKLIKVDKNISASLEMYEQRLSTVDINKYDTKVSFKYELGENISNLYLVDCFIEKNNSNYRTCTNLGYFDSNGKMTKLNSRNNGVLGTPYTNEAHPDDDSKLIFKFLNDINTGNHTFYLLTEKGGIDFSNIYGFNESKYSVNDYFYVVASLEYSTDYEIYNINHASDFFDNNLIKLNGDNKHYVVTKNINFYNHNEINYENYIIKSERFKNFKGTIDFQGYSVDLYRDTISKFNLFNSNYGTLKNAVLNYYINYTGVEQTPIYGFINNNYGNIENIIVNVEQNNVNGRGSKISLLAYANYGLINNFVLNLKTDIHAFSSSSLVTYINYQNGIISNGYVKNENDSKVILYDSSSQGNFSNTNHGIIKNVYNLVDVVSNNNSYSIGTIVKTNSSTGILKNCISVATTTQNSNDEIKFGPSVYSNSGSINNNFYVDTNPYNSNYNNNYNTRISKAALMNPSFLDIVLNSEQSFSITSGYYPLLKFNDFMKNKQSMIKIQFDYYNEITLDVLSSEVIQNNENNNQAKAKIFISNPQKVEITDIGIVGLSAEIDKNSTFYNESTQTTELMVNLNLDDKDIAKTNYEIYSVTYMDPLSGAITKEYSENNLRRLDIVMYRNVNLYNDLIKYINSNENIFITDNIIVPKLELIFPDDTEYSAILNGNNKTLDFNNANINKDYFIYSLTGTLKNLQVSNLKVHTTGDYVGFIRTTMNANIENIDIKNVSLIISNDSSIGNFYLGSVVSYAEKTSIDRVSANNLEITTSDGYSGIIRRNNIGGIIGYLYSSQIQNSYVYELNLHKLNKNSDVGREAIGGIVGYASSNSVITSCYSTGLIHTDFSNVGGILGVNYRSQVNNNYSYLKIIVSGDYIGGIVGQITPYYGYGASSVKNNLFIGDILPLTKFLRYSLIVPFNYTSTINNNYTLKTDDYLTNEKVIDLMHLMDFDSEFTFIQDEGLPYLKQSSFVKQSIMSQQYLDLAQSNIEYSFEYNNTDGDVIDYSNIKDVNKENSYITSDLYQNVLATELIFDIIDDNNYQILADNNQEFIVKIFDDYDANNIINKKYKLKPNKYKTGYSLNISDKNGNIIETIYLNISFYRKVYNIDDWNNIEKLNNENIILLNNIEISSDTSKNINNLLGVGHTILVVDGANIIENITGEMRDVNFVGRSESQKIKNQQMYGIIKYNNGKIENCSFKDINIRNKSKITGIIAVSNGYINNVNLSNVKISGTSWVGSLVGYDETNFLDRVHMTNIKAKDIEIKGKNCIGGIAGRITYAMENIDAYNVNILPEEFDSDRSRAYIGGIVGSGDCKKNCSITNSTIKASGTYIGGISGVASEKTVEKNYLKLENTRILDTGTIKSSYVGGLYGETYYIYNSNVNHLIIAKESGEQHYTNFNSTYTGGIVGSGVSFYNISVKNSSILGSKNVGGIVGGAWNGYVYNSVVVNSAIESTNENAGGIVGYSGYASDAIHIIGNIVSRSNISSSNNSGGIVGNIKNSTTNSQIVKFSDNEVLSSEIYATNSYGVAGGLIGYLYQVPSSSDILFNKSLFYGNVNNGNETICNDCTLVGKIEKNNTGSSTGYGNYGLTNLLFSQKSNFKEYISEEIYNHPYKINSIDSINSFLPGSTFDYVEQINDNYYFPNRKNDPKLLDEEKVIIPYDSKIGYQASPRLLMMSRAPRNYLNVYNNSLDINYDIYSSGIDKINIEFNETNPNLYLYYEIGDYKSNNISINNRTYTLTYDYKNDIKIYITDGINYKESVIKSNDVAKTLNIINSKVYYIANKKLYSEDKMIVGNFVNLYGNEALTEDGKIYDINTKQVINSNINYELLLDSTPIYEFNYKGTNIKTYYNYSLVNNVIKDLQLFVKNGNLNFIDTSLENKKNMYIIDYYNGNEIQIILKDDGKLYSIKHNIEYPKNIINNNIKELYSNINSSDNIVALKYKDNSIYSFDYRTGKLLFTNVSSEYNSFLEYVKDKIKGSSNFSEIENISNYSDFKEIELLKSKIYDVSVDEANDKIYGTNNSLISSDNYISAYNDITKKYDIYKVENILNNSLEVETETDKIYRNYELVKFYNTLGKNKNKININGIIMFSISITLIIFTLFLLIKHKKLKRGEN